MDAPLLRQKHLVYWVLVFGFGVMVPEDLLQRNWLQALTHATLTLALLFLRDTE